MALEVSGPILDAHAHFFSRRFFEKLGSQLGDRVAKGRELQAIEEIAQVEVPSSDPESLAERWVRELDRVGVAEAVMIASIPGDHGNVLQAAARYPDRLIPYAMFNPLEPMAASSLKEAARQGLAGVCLFPAMHHFHVFDAPVMELLQVAAEQALVVLVHFGMLRVAIRDKLGLPSPFDLRYSNPVDLCSAAQRFPRVPFVVPHLGCGYLREALMLCRQCPNVLLDTSSSNSWVQTQTQTMTVEDTFARTVDVIGPSRLLFGSDSTTFPRGYRSDLLERQVTIFRDLGVAASEEALIFGGNLIRILGRKPEEGVA